MIRSLRVLAAVAIAMSCGCTVESNARIKSNWAAAFRTQCARDVEATPGLAVYGETYCGCVADKYLATFSGIQLAIVSLSKPLHDAGRAIRRQCSRIAITQGEYKQFLRSVNARSDLAITAYVTPDFSATDVHGHSEDTERWLAGLNARPSGDDDVAVVRAVDVTPKRKTVRLELSYDTEKAVRGTNETVETRSFLSDTWVDGDGTPLLKHSTTTMVETYVDGKLASRVKSK
jgi:hypothetical protein